VFLAALFWVLSVTVSNSDIMIYDDMLVGFHSQKDAAVPMKAKSWMISAANPHAVRAGAQILDMGGTAADAMVAIQSVLGLVEPQSSGLGGGAFLIWYDGKNKTITTLDGRETAPRAITSKLFIDGHGVPLKFFDAVIGGKSVGVPGVPALMLEAHTRWGQLDWPSLFDYGISLSQSGFFVSPRLAMLLKRDAIRLKAFDRTANYFFPEGKKIKVGHVLKNLSYAKTLEQFANDKGESFYNGVLAEDIVQTVQNSAKNPGDLDRIDLANYEVRERPAVCIDYRGLEVCGMGPPSSGGVAVGQILGLLESFDLSATGAESIEAWRLFGDAQRLAFADRARYLADPDFVSVPVEGLLDKEYLKSRAALLVGSMALKEVKAGVPLLSSLYNLADDNSLELPSTSHFSIVDQYGNALSMTTTIENTFGSRLMTKGGFLLNNEMTDFSFRSHEGSALVANRIEPGKRPRSSMAPTIVLKDKKPVLVVGSPGGSRIISYVAQTIIAYIDWGMDVQKAVAMPHLVNRFGPYDVELGTEAEKFNEGLIRLGYKVKSRVLNSGLHAIAITANGLEGGADPRREGIVYGK
jgi:gamma-glutamyltranspeptidase/glutathione hydrolase